MLERVKRSIEITDKYMLEVQNITPLMIVGFTFVFGGEQLKSTTTWGKAMFEVLPAVIWGLLYFGAGCFHIICLRKNWKGLDKWNFCLIAALWVFLGSLLYLELGWWVPVAYIYFLFAAIALRSYFKIEVGALY